MQRSPRRRRAGRLTEWGTGRTQAAVWRSSRTRSSGPTASRSSAARPPASRPNSTVQGSTTRRHRLLPDRSCSTRVEGPADGAWRDWGHRRHRAGRLAAFAHAWDVGTERTKRPRSRPSRLSRAGRRPGFIGWVPLARVSRGASPARLGRWLTSARVDRTGSVEAAGRDRGDGDRGRIPRNRARGRDGRPSAALRRAGTPQPVIDEVVERLGELWLRR
jgi:hypothetical protein